MNNKITIGQTADYLGCSIETLRRWDKEKIFTAHRKENNYRYYLLSDIEDFSEKLNLFKIAEHWIKSKKSFEPLPCYFCPDSFIFKSRFTRLQKNLEEKNSSRDLSSLLSSMVGEIGNNSFDHNIGNWPNITGIFFGYNLRKKRIVLADRGQGILKTLKRIKPRLKNHGEALNTAFTEIISGRKPEHRGNGLKFVKIIIENSKIRLFFQTGNAKINLKRTKKFQVKKSNISLGGCLAKIEF